MTFRVKDWDSKFESAKSRSYKIKSQTYLPNKHGVGYMRIMREPDGAAIYGAWCAMVGLLSKQESPRHGYLTDTGKDTGVSLDAETVSMLTLVPKAVVSRMLLVCSSQPIGWLVVVNHKDTTKDTAKDTAVPLTRAESGIADGPSPLPSPLPSPSPSPSMERERENYVRLFDALSATGRFTHLDAICVKTQLYAWPNLVITQEVIDTLVGAALSAGHQIDAPDLWLRKRLQLLAPLDRNNKPAVPVTPGQKPARDPERPWTVEQMISGEAYE